ncbi:LysE family translocator [Arcobacter sp. LA11]|uniref:LysE family translocator n=1 Tax=Arcobacter sp. LA11 TaxID=1898176 RepID=UPI0009339F87|nr:LysE family translocator [Arcobacter sp. LA11]
MNTDIILVYSLVAFFYIISPGPAIFLALTNGILYDMKMVMTSSFGNILGLFILSAISISGLGVILVTSSTLFMIVKVVGAVYLIYLGIKQFRSASSLKLNKKEKKKYQKSLKKGFFESFFLAVTNPKPIIFFIALFPQFLSLENDLIPQFFIMTGIFMFFSFISLCIYGFIAKSTKEWFKKENTMIWFHRVTGGLFIGLGFSLFKLKNIQN